MTTRIKLTVGAGLLALGVLAGATVPALAESAQPNPSVSAVAGPTHQQMDQMMDAVHGAGTSRRMQETLGPDAEKIMDGTKATLGQMQTMMSGANAQAMQSIVNSPAMQAMMNGSPGQ